MRGDYRELATVLAVLLACLIAYLVTGPLDGWDLLAIGIGWSISMGLIALYRALYRRREERR